MAKKKIPTVNDLTLTPKRVKDGTCASEFQR